MNKEDYNNEPVHYCVNCLSLALKELDDIKVEICLECGNSEFDSCSIDEWNKLFVKEYGKLFLDQNE